jgi:hypothetical protein
MATWSKDFLIEFIELFKTEECGGSYANLSDEISILVTD